MSGLWSRYASRRVDDHPDDEDVLPFAIESLEVNLLQVSLAESGLTFTTVINSRTDPELASEIQSEVARYRNRWLPLRSKLNAVDAAIQEFQKTVAQRVGTTPAAFNHLSETVADMRRTFSVWAVPEVGTEERPVEPEALPSRVSGYSIYLWIEGVGGESVDSNHGGGSTARRTARQWGGRYVRRISARDLRYREGAGSRVPGSLPCCSHGPRLRAGDCGCVPRRGAFTENRDARCEDHAGASVRGFIAGTFASHRRGFLSSTGGSNGRIRKCGRQSGKATRAARGRSPRRLRSHASGTRCFINPASYFKRPLPNPASTEPDKKTVSTQRRKKSELRSD